MKRYKVHYLVFLIILSACSTKSTSPGMTLLTGLTGYHEEMERLEGQAARWPDRQRLGNTIKTTYLMTMGGSKEFNRLVELDVKRREYLIALRANALRPDRAAEVNQELIKIDEEIDALSGLIKGQITRHTMSDPEPQKLIEGVATVGLLSMAIDNFSQSLPQDVSVPTAMVGGYMVIDQKNIAIVKTPEGQTFRCTTSLVQEEGAGIDCAALSGK
jgi:hypothetical protein